jgi:hypothetical protein
MKILTNKEKKLILRQKQKAIIESFKDNFNKIKRPDDILETSLYSETDPTDGDHGSNKEAERKAIELYDKGKAQFNLGDKEGAERLRQEAIKVASFELGWDDAELPPYISEKRSAQYLDDAYHSIEPYGKYILKNTLKVSESEEGSTMEFKLQIPSSISGNPKEFAKELNYNSHGVEGNPGGYVSHINAYLDGFNETNNTYLFSISITSQLDV